MTTGEKFANKLKVEVCDMSPDDKSYAEKIIVEAFEQERREDKIANRIKTDFDKNKGKWLH